MKANKGNKVYTITEGQRKFYVDAGYDIMDDEGDVIEYGKGKTVLYTEYAEVKKELDELRSAVQGKSQKAVDPPEKSKKKTGPPKVEEGGGQ